MALFCVAWWESWIREELCTSYISLLYRCISYISICRIPRAAPCRRAVALFCEWHGSGRSSSRLIRLLYISISLISLICVSLRAASPLRRRAVALVLCGMDRGGALHVVYVSCISLYLLSLICMSPRAAPPRCRGAVALFCVWHGGIMEGESDQGRALHVLYIYIISISLYLV